MTADRILALDVGTQSVRAMIFDPAGNLLARTKVPIEPYVPGPPGCCEQDPELYWRSIGEATEAAMVSGLAPGKVAVIWMVGKSTAGNAATGSSR